jgi:hypothetical protein
MTWYLRIIPNECDSIAITVNNEYWTRWYRTEGDVTRQLPGRFQNNSSIKIGGIVAPEGKNATMEIRWDSRVVKTMNFDNYEDQTVNNAPPPPPGHDRDRPGGRLGLLPDNTTLSQDDGVGQGSSIAIFSSGVLTNRHYRKPI